MAAKLLMRFLFRALKTATHSLIVHHHEYDPTRNANRVNFSSNQALTRLGQALTHQRRGFHQINLDVYRVARATCNLSGILTLLNAKQLKHIIHNCW